MDRESSNLTFADAVYSGLGSILAAVVLWILIGGQLIWYILGGIIWAILCIISWAVESRERRRDRERRRRHREQQNREWRAQFNELAPTIRAAIRMVREDRRETARVLALLAHLKSKRREKVDWKKEGF